MLAPRTYVFFVAYFCFYYLEAPWSFVVFSALIWLNPVVRYLIEAATYMFGAFKCTHGFFRAILVARSNEDRSWRAACLLFVPLTLVIGSPSKMCASFVCLLCLCFFNPYISLRCALFLYSFLLIPNPFFVCNALMLVYVLSRTLWLVPLTALLALLPFLSIGVQEFLWCIVRLLLCVDLLCSVWLRWASVVDKPQYHPAEYNSPGITEDTRNQVFMVGRQPVYLGPR